MSEQLLTYVFHLRQIVLPLLLGPYTQRANTGPAVYWHFINMEYVRVSIALAPKQLK